MASRPPKHRSLFAHVVVQRQEASGRAYDARRRRNSPWRAWYSLKAWFTARQAQLARQPLCERHLARGDVVAATVVNHRIPHRGAWALFIDPANHESVCKPCHDGDIQREERAAAADVSPGGGSKVYSRPGQ